MDQLDDSKGSVGAAEVTADDSGFPIIKLTGEIDISSVDSVRATIEPTVSKAPERIVFDLSGLDFLDSSGIALLLYAAAKSGSVHLRNPSSIVRRTIEVTGLSDVLHIDP